MGDKPRYTSRINIIDAFQYPGSLAQAPAWIDRNWVGYSDADYIRGIDAGPVLRVPSPADPDNLVTIARVGDYVCRQSVLLDEGVPPEIRVEVWSREQFQKLFVPDRRPPIIGQSPHASHAQAKPLTDHDQAAIDALNQKRAELHAAARAPTPEQASADAGAPLSTQPVLARQPPTGSTAVETPGHIPGPTHGAGASSGAGGLGEVMEDAPLASSDDEEITVDLRTEKPTPS